MVLGISMYASFKYVVLISSIYFPGITHLEMCINDNNFNVTFNFSNYSYVLVINILLRI